LCLQLRGEAGPRQVEGAKVALQHNLGLGGAVVVALYKMGFPKASGAAAAGAGVQKQQARAYSTDTNNNRFMKKIIDIEN